MLKIKGFQEALKRWVNALKVHKPEAKRVFIGTKGYYSKEHYFAYDGLIYVKAGTNSYPIDCYLGEHECN